MINSNAVRVPVATGFLLAMMATANYVPPQYHGVASFRFPMDGVEIMSNGIGYRNGLSDATQLSAAFAQPVFDASITALESAAQAFNASLLADSKPLGSEFAQILEDNLWDLLVR